MNDTPTSELLTNYQRYYQLHSPEQCAAEKAALLENIAVHENAIADLEARLALIDDRLANPNIDINAAEVELASRGINGKRFLRAGTKEQRKMAKAKGSNA